MSSGKMDLKMASKKTSRHKKSLKITKTNRAKRDPASGKVISRRQYDKKYGRKPRPQTKNYSQSSFQKKIYRYQAVRDRYIELYNKKHKKKIGKREAMDSDALKKIVKNLRVYPNESPAHKEKRIKELEKLGFLDRDDAGVLQSDEVLARTYGEDSDDE
jgi:hypothetical protein